MVGQSLKPTVYISVLNWNGYAKTIRCLEGLKALEYNNFKIVVVDNASADDSVVHLRSAYPNLEIICSNNNLGYAGGNQLALQRALEDSADLFWILNNDTSVRPDTLTQLVNAYRRHGEALSSSLPLNSPEPRPDSVVPFPRKFLVETFKEDILTRHPFKTYRELFPDGQDRMVGALPGTCLMIPLSIVRKFGFMDSSYFMYSEEIDYCLRLRRQGVAGYIVPSSIIYHSVKGSSSGNYRLEGIVGYYIVRNRLIRIRRYEPKRLTLILVAFLGIGRGLIKLVYLPRPRNPRGGKKALWLAYCSLRGVFDGLAGKMGKTLKPEDYVGNSP